MFEKNAQQEKIGMTISRLQFLFSPKKISSKNSSRLFDQGLFGLLFDLTTIFELVSFSCSLFLLVSRLSMKILQGYRLFQSKFMTTLIGTDWAFINQIGWPIFIICNEEQVQFWFMELCRKLMRQVT